MILDDDEVQWLIDQEANVYMAAAAVADLLAQRTTASTAGGNVGAVTKKKVGPTELMYSTDGTSAADFRSLAMTLRARGRSHQVPLAGGIDRSGKTAQRDDTDRVKPYFYRGLNDTATTRTE